MSHTIKDAMVWVDVETTGLERDSQILEVGLIVTDLDMVALEQMSVIIQPPKEVDWLGQMNEYVRKMHTNNGLIMAIEDGHGYSMRAAETKLRMFYEMFVGKENKTPMCGSTVPQDRVWLHYQMLNFEQMFSHRHIDNSTIKELCRRYNPRVYEGVTKLQEEQGDSAHRVIEDLQDTLSEARFYRDNFLFDARP